ncbi:hypothetical protein V1524DRAFT_437909 [Lipomyces starkeyi]
MMCAFANFTDKTGRRNCMTYLSKRMTGIDCSNGWPIQVSQENFMSDLLHWIQIMEPDTVHFAPRTVSTLYPSDMLSVKYI